MSISTSRKKILKIDDSFNNLNRKNAKAIADDLITKFIVNSGASLNTVNQSDFKDMVSGLSKLNSEVSCFTKNTLAIRIKSQYDEMIKKIIEDLKRAKYVCTTSDIWSSFRRSFLGVTAHWLVDETLERKYVALACRRFKGTHDFKSIAKMLSEIHQYFGLSVQKFRTE